MCDFSDGFNSIDADGVLNIYIYLMKRNDIKESLELSKCLLDY